MLPVNATSCCCCPSFWKLHHPVSLAQVLALLLPPPPPLPLPPPPLWVCFRPNSLHPYILCTSQLQLSAQHWVGWQGSLIRKWNCPQEQVGLWLWEMPSYSCSALPPTLGLGTRTGCCPWLFLHWWIAELCWSQPIPCVPGSCSAEAGELFPCHAMWRWNFQIVRTLKPAVTDVSASAVDKGVQKSLVAMHGWRRAGRL